MDDKSTDTSAAALQALIASAPIGLGFIDREFRYIQINEPLALLNGASVAEHIGRRVREIVPDAAPQLEPLLEEVIRTGHAKLNLELNVVLPGRTEEHNLMVNYFPIRTEAGVIGVGAAVVDVSELKEVTGRHGALAWS